MKPSIQVYNTGEKAREYHNGFQPGSLRDRMLTLTAQAVRDGLPQGGRVLELGAGTGHLTHKLALLGPLYPLQATDGAPEMLQVAQEALPEVHFQPLDYFEPGWWENFRGVDAVASSLTFHYHPEKERLFQEIWDLLPSGGILAFADKVAPEHPFLVQLFHWERARRNLGRDPTPDEVEEVWQAQQAWNSRSGKQTESIPQLLAQLQEVGFKAGTVWQDFDHAVLVAMKS